MTEQEKDEFIEQLQGQIRTWCDAYKAQKAEMQQLRRMVRIKEHAAEELKGEIARQEESHKMEVEQLLMKISGLEKLVETADKVIKQMGGFTVKDITFNGVKLEGPKKEDK